MRARVCVCLSLFSVCLSYSLPRPPTSMCAPFRGVFLSDETVLQPTTAGHEQCLKLTRPGAGPMHGDASLCASASLPHAWGWAAESEARQAFSRFGGTLSVSSVAAPIPDLQAALFGAVSVSAMVPPTTNATLTISFGWSFPYRDMYNYGVEGTFAPFGNKYADHYADSVESAWGTSAAGGPREAALADVVSAATVVSHTLSGSSLPAWLSDLLANSLSHTRDSMWWQRCPHCHNSSDPRVGSSTFGVWRQYEAYDCPDIGTFAAAKSPLPSLLLLCSSID